MTLEFGQLLDSIDLAAKTMADQWSEYRRLAEDARRRLERFSEKLAFLERRVESAEIRLGGNWRGAGPRGEFIGSVYDPPSQVKGVQHIIAADGSQIFPDRHGIAHYALVNIGAVRIRPGSGEPPELQTFPDLIFGDRLQDDEKAEPLQATDISRQRDMQELSKLVELSADMGAGTIALLDSPLALWMLQPDPKKELFDWFVNKMNTARSAGVRLAGYVDRPGSRGVADLLALAGVDEDQLSPENEGLRCFRELPDRVIFRTLLKPGQRSALFVSSSPFNRRLRARSDELQVAFFYINVGAANEPTLARVELPCWVANDASEVEQLHYAIWDQCRAPGRYPYVLARAHEVAVVSQEQRGVLEDMLARAMLAQGLAPTASAKSFLKSLTVG